MKKNSVEDILQNDTGNKSKTKTILLLAIVAIILISVFLIIAWVMTRDNPVHTLSDANANNRVLSQQIDNTPQTIPYAHNIDSNAQSNFLSNGHNDQQDQLGLNLDNTQGREMAMSSVPPVGVQTQTSETSMGMISALAETGGNYEDDQRYQAALRDLEQRHGAKSVADNVKSQEQAQVAPVVPSVQPVQDKVVTPSVPKEAPIATLNQPTKTTLDKDAKEGVKPISKEKEELKDAKKPADQNVKQQQEIKPQDVKPKEVQKTPASQPKPAEPVVQKQPVEAQKPQAQTEKPKQPVELAQDKVIQRSQSVVDANQGKVPEKGHYIQVGSFAAQDQDKMKPFLNKISKYNYRKLDVKMNDGSTTVKYLIGPYKTREEAKQIETKIRTEINSGAFHYEVK